MDSGSEKNALIERRMMLSEGGLKYTLITLYVV
jgi:hypothetical protein